MGDQFVMHTAFSREGPNKVYVQHLLKQQGKEINELLEQKAYFYVCGDAANMAREVNTVLAQIIAEHRGVSEAKAEEIVKNMRAANQYQVSLQSDINCVRCGADKFCRRTFGHRKRVYYDRIFCEAATVCLVEYVVCCWGYRSPGIVENLFEIQKA
jgi:hypothetical protein